MPITIESQAITEFENARYWLALKFIPRLAVNKKLALVKHFGLKPLFSSPPAQQQSKLTDKQQRALMCPDWSRIDVRRKWRRTRSYSG